MTDSSLRSTRPTLVLALLVLFACTGAEDAPEVVGTPRPASPAQALATADSLQSAGAWEAAFRAWRLADSISGGQPDAVYGLVSTALVAGEWRAGLQSIVDHPELFAMGDWTGRFDDAVASDASEEDLRALYVEWSEAVGDLSFGLARAYLDLGRPDDALSVLEARLAAERTGGLRVFLESPVGRPLAGHPRTDSILARLGG